MQLALCVVGALAWSKPVLSSPEAGRSCGLVMHVQVEGVDNTRVRKALDDAQQTWEVCLEICPAARSQPSSATFPTLQSAAKNRVRHDCVSDVRGRRVLGVGEGPEAHSQPHLEGWAVLQASVLALQARQMRQCVDPCRSFSSKGGRATRKREEKEPAVESLGEGWPSPRSCSMQADAARGRRG